MHTVSVNRYVSGTSTFSLAARSIAFCYYESKINYWCSFSVLIAPYISYVRVIDELQSPPHIMLIWPLSERDSTWI